MGFPDVSDLGNQYRDYLRAEFNYRPAINTTFFLGALVVCPSVDLQTQPDMKTVALAGTGAAQQLIRGFVSEAWAGFNGSIGVPSYVSPTTALISTGTEMVDTVIWGFHPSVALDQSGTGAVTVTNGIPLVPSRGTAGYVQGVAATTAAGASGYAANALLPASGIGSSLTAAALAQASQTDTLTGTPAVGDTLSVTIQSPYVSTAPGTAQTITWTTPPLTSAQAATVTTAALALVTYLNGVPSFSQYFTATQVAGVVTITVNALATPFTVNFGSGTSVYSSFQISISGMVANSLTFAVSSTGGTVSTAGAANLASGTGYKGVIPAMVVPNVL